MLRRQANDVMHETLPDILMLWLLMAFSCSVQSVASSAVIMSFIRVTYVDILLSLINYIIHVICFNCTLCLSFSSVYESVYGYNPR